MAHRNNLESSSCPTLSQELWSSVECKEDQKLINTGEFRAAPRIIACDFHKTPPKLGQKGSFFVERTIEF